MITLLGPGLPIVFPGLRGRFVEGPGVAPMGATSTQLPGAVPGRSVDGQLLELGELRASRCHEHCAAVLTRRPGPHRADSAEKGCLVVSERDGDVGYRHLLVAPVKDSRQL